MILPPVLLGAWGAAYLIDVADFVTAPGVPMIFEYEAQGGKVRLKTTSYSVDARRQRVTARGLEVVDSKGIRVARVDRLVVVRSEDGRIRVEATDIDALLDRLPDGQFAIQALLPAPTEPEGPENHIEVVAKRLQIRYRDRTRPQTLNMAINAPALEAVGVGSTWRATGRANIAGVGQVPFDLLLGDQGLYKLDLALQNTALLPLLPVIERYQPADFRWPFEASDLRATGDLQLDGDATGRLALYGRMGVEARGLVVGDLRLDRARAPLQLFGQSAEGSLEADGSGLALRAPNLALDWRSEFQGRATGQVRVANLRQLPATWRRGLPSGLRTEQLEWTGDAGWKGGEWLARGTASARQVVVQAETVRNIKVDLVADPKSLAANVREANWLGQPVRGAAQLDLRSGASQGFLTSTRVDLGKLSRHYGTAVPGRAEAQAVWRVERGRPQLWIAAKGRATATIAEGRPRVEGDFQVRLAGQPSALVLERGTFTSEEGALLARGQINLASQSLDLTLNAGRVRADAFIPDLEGTAFVSGRVQGSFSAPKFNSEVEVVDLNINGVEIPLLSLTAEGDPREIRFKEIRARNGLSRVVGNVAFQPGTGRIEGTFEAPNLQLAEILDGQAAGNVQLTRGVLSGTVDRPVVEAQLRGGAIAYSGATISGFEGVLRASRDAIRIDQSQFVVSDQDLQGTIALKGEFRPGSGTGEIEMQWQDLPIRPLSQFDARLSAAGQSSGDAVVRFDRQGIREGQVNGTLADLILNGQRVGGGSINASVQQREIEVTGQVGSIDRFLTIDRLKVLPDGTWDGQVTGFNLRSETLVQLAAPLFEDAPEEVREILLELGGAVSGIVALRGGKDDLEVESDQLTVDRFRVRDREAGQIETRFSRKLGRWNLADAQWRIAPDQFVTVKGSVGDAGDLQLDFNANKLDLSWVSAFAPDVPVLPAVLTTQASISGNVDDPTVQVSAELDAILRGDTAANVARAPSVVLFGELRNGQLTLDGNFQAQGFAGPVRASGPLTAFTRQASELAATDQVVAEATVQPRDLTEFRDLLQGMDFARSSGKLGGTLTWRGNREQSDLQGNLRFEGTPQNPAKIAFEGVSTELNQANLLVELLNGTLSLDAKATSSKGGALEVKAQIPAQFPEDGDLQRWLATTPIQGSVRLNDLKWVEGEMARNNLIDVTASTSNLEIGGTLKEPVIAGDVVLKRVGVDLPEFKEQEGTFTPPVNPKFDLRLRSEGGVRLRTGTANLVANASGTIGGSLLNPVVTGGLDVRDGVLRLPNARIQLEEGGTVGFSFRTEGEGTPVIEVPVSLIGRTSVSARRGTTGYQRYDLTLNLLGDLLRPGDLQIQGQSEPADLSQDEILAIIGQRDLIESLIAGAQDTQSEQFREALLGLFVPTLSELFTGQIANAFQLDYIALDYNPFEGTVLSAAKSFNRFLTVEGRRRVTDTSTLSNFDYELRLVYRIPSQNRVLSRARLVLSTDNIRPWRIAIEYSFRPR